MDALLQDLMARPWALEEGAPPGLAPAEFYLAGGDPTVTVRVADWTGRGLPKREALERLWGTIARKLSVVVLVVRRVEDGREVVDIVGGRTTSGKGAPRPIVRRGTPITEGCSLCRAVLEEPTSQAAGDLVARWLDERATEVPGLKNDGLFATYTLRHRVPDRIDWPGALDHAKRLRDRAGRELIEQLGFTIKTTDHPRATLLVGAESQRAVALFLDDDESFDDASAKFGNRTPVSTALAIARTHNVPWILLTRGRSVRLHPVSPDKGVGRRGRSTTYAEIDLRLLPDDRAAYLWLLFSANALAEEGSAEQILRDSASYASDLGVRLRDRIYVDVVPALAELVAERMRREGEADVIDDRWLDEAYRTTMVLLFRTLFVAYAEDRGLLPYERNERYTERSLNRVAQVLDRVIEEATPFDDHDESLWDAVTWTWTTIAKGNREAGVPPYGGGLFEEHPFLDKALRSAPFTNAEIGPILAELLLDRDEDGELGPVDFRSLSVREFGTIYEGLLESELSVAETDLGLDREGNYIPLTASDGAPPRRKKLKEPGAIEAEVAVRAGAIYFHNRSGARKSSGTYFTKPFVVEHLLDQALEPAISDHLARVSADLQRGDEAAAGERFFDFRVADIAMGSGHFLIAAIDRIEARFGDFLAENGINAVRRELSQLRSAAIDGLGGSEDSALVEEAALLRRQIARRCIYGVDLNRVAVELARLAVWIHTFVPGLPLSYLDHTLVVGNSLTGVGTLDEAEAIVIDPASGRASFAAMGVREELARALPALERLRTVSDATVKDVQAAAGADAEARTAVAPLSWLLDLLVLQRAGIAGVDLFDTDASTVDVLRARPEVRDALHDLAPLHFPAVFPEVFLRGRVGFDCILGNPPWEKTQVEEHQWWSIRIPGIRSLPVGELNKRIDEARTARPDLTVLFERDRAAADAMRRVLVRGPYPDMGTAHPDLYRAFAWRFWRLLAGHAGVVFPRGILAGAGTAGWRREVLTAKGLAQMTVVTNRSNWVFDDMEPRYTIALVVLDRSRERPVVEIEGPYAGMNEYLDGRSREPVGLAADDVLEWTEGATFPLLPTLRAAETFAKLRAQPRLDEEGPDWAFRPVQGDLNATTGKPFMELVLTDQTGLWPVYGGGSFNLWRPDTGDYYAWARPEVVIPELERRRLRASRLARSAWNASAEVDLSDATSLPCRRPRIAWRDVARATDTRTLIPSLIPPEVVLSHKAPYLLRRRGGAAEEAFLLAVFSSIPLDWFARRFIEIHVSFQLLTSFPVPRPTWDDERARRLVALTSGLVAADSRFKMWLAELEAKGLSRADCPDYEAAVAEIDALVAHMYRLDEADLHTIFQTFHAGWDFKPRLEAVLRFYRDWEGA